MTQEIINEILTYSYTVASTDLTYSFLHGDRISQLEKDEAIYLTNEMTRAIDKIVDHIIEEIKPASTLNDAKDLLIRAFTYCFDKSIEMVYKLLAEVDEDIEFNFSDLYNGMGGDQIPEHIQLKITPIIPKVAMTFNATFDHIIEQEYSSNHNIKDLIKVILFCGMHLGTEFCLRTDLQNFSEFNNYMGY